MQKWEYLVVTIGDTSGKYWMDGKQLQVTVAKADYENPYGDYQKMKSTILNNVGMQGWELTMKDTQGSLIFKRPKL
ncbi:MAG TPA: hypothetical protein VGB98_15910 [Pyrinomonadaceae bacterium]|jgi:hypothetical protein